MSVKTNVLMPLCLMPFLISCAAKPVDVTTRTEKVYPPVELVQECSEPAEPVEMTWRSLAGWLLDYKAALRQCNNDKELLQKWMSES